MLRPGLTATDELDLVYVLQKSSEEGVVVTNLPVCREEKAAPNVYSWCPHQFPCLEGKCAMPCTHQDTWTTLVNQRPSLAPHGHTGSLGRTESEGLRSSPG